MKRLFLLLVTTFFFVHCSCPSGFDLVHDGECRGLYTDMRISWSHATRTVIEKCKEIHALPIIIHNEEQQSYWTERDDNNIDISNVIGLLCNSSSRKWEWADGSDMYYKPPHYGRELDLPCSTGTWRIRSGTWLYRICKHFNFSIAARFSGTYTTHIYCKKQLRIQPGNVCDRLNESGACYQIAKAQNWEDADKICHTLGSELASIHSVEENLFLSRIAVSQGVNAGLVIGARREENDFLWIDGTEWNYSNFYSGFPINGYGDCVAMDTRSDLGEWINTNCSSIHNVACMRHQTRTNYTCTSGPWQEGQIIQSPGFPHDASTQCDLMLKVDSGKKIEVEVILLEANSCCDHLIIYENFIGRNLIANLTGRIVDRTITTKSSNEVVVSWRPKGGVNVMGMMISFRGV